MFSNRLTNKEAVFFVFLWFTDDQLIDVMILLLLILFYVAVSVVLYVYLTNNPLHISGFSRLGWKRNVLFVIAHPDDECMFFGPTIIHLTAAGHKVHLICLSTGEV